MFDVRRGCRGQKNFGKLRERQYLNLTLSWGWKVLEKESGRRCSGWRNLRRSWKAKNLQNTTEIFSDNFFWRIFALSWNLAKPISTLAADPQPEILSELNRLVATPMCDPPRPADAEHLGCDTAKPLISKQASAGKSIPGSHRWQRCFLPLEALMHVVLVAYIVCHRCDPGRFVRNQLVHQQGKIARPGTLEDPSSSGAKGAAATLVVPVHEDRVPVRTLYLSRRRASGRSCSTLAKFLFWG